MLQIYFKKSYGDVVEVAQVESLDLAYNEIEKFCIDRGFQITYVRRWEQENMMIVDVGSYMELFYVVEIQDNK